MRKFNDYKEVETQGFNKKLDVGPHYCKIMDVKYITIQGKNGPFDQLVFNIDIDDDDTQAKFFSKKYSNDLRENPQTAKWRGIFKMFLPKDDGSEKDKKTKIAFKTFIKCIESSNPGYDWEKSNWEEKSLIGKKFIGVFGIREYTNMDGKVSYLTECRFVRSINLSLEEIPVPRVKLVDGSYIPFEDWLEKRQEERENKKNDVFSNNNSTFSSQPIMDDDLPF